MFSPLILSNISLRDRCSGGTSTTQVMMQHQVSAWVLTWCWYPVLVLIIKCVIPRPYEAECIICQLRWSRAAVAESFEDRWDKKEASLPCWGSIFLFVIRTWCIQVQNHSVLAPWKTLCCFFFFSKRFSFTTTQTQTPPQKKKNTKMRQRKRLRLCEFKVNEEIK